MHWIGRYAVNKFVQEFRYSCLIICVQRRSVDLAPCCQKGRTESRRGEEHSPRSKESQEEGKATAASAVITFHMQQRLPLACRAVQPRAKMQIDPATWMLHHRLPKTEGCPRREANVKFNYGIAWETCQKRCLECICNAG